MQGSTRRDREQARGPQPFQSPMTRLLRWLRRWWRPIRVLTWARRETQASIEDWRLATFGPVRSTMSIVTRANEEMSELLRALSRDDMHPKAASEVADVVIILYGAAQRLGVDLHAEVDKKMTINRARRWNLTGDGHGQHIKEETVTCNEFLCLPERNPSHYVNGRHKARE